MGTKRKATVLDALASLVEKGFIQKRERWEKGKKMCDYRPVRRQVRKTYRTGTESVPHNTIDNHIGIKEIKNKEIGRMSLDDFSKTLK